MKRFITIAIFLFSFFSVSSKNKAAYRATYIFKIQTDSSFSFFDLPKNKMYNRTDTSLTNTRTLKQIDKLILNSIFFTANCSEPGNVVYVRHAPFESQHTANRNLNFVVSSSNTSVTYIDNLGKFYLPQINDSFKCYSKIDTAKLHFRATGNRKKIGVWNCEEFVSESKELLSIWITRSLGDYINPGIFPVGLKGGVVEIDYKNGKLQLTDVTEINPFYMPKFANPCNETKNLLEAGYLNSM